MPILGSWSMICLILWKVIAECSTWRSLEPRPARKDSDRIYRRSLKSFTTTVGLALQNP